MDMSAPSYLCDEKYNIRCPCKGQGGYEATVYLLYLSELKKRALWFDEGLYIWLESRFTDQSSSKLTSLLGDLYFLFCSASFSILFDIAIITLFPYVMSLWASQVLTRIIFHVLCCQCPSTKCFYKYLKLSWKSLCRSFQSPTHLCVSHVVQYETIQSWCLSILATPQDETLPSQTSIYR